MVVSKKFDFRKEDFNKSIQNAKLFLAPLLLLYLGYVTGNVRDGFQWNDFLLDGALMTAVVLFILNFLTDVIKKWATYNRYN